MAPPKNPEQHGMAFSAFAHIPDLQSLEFAVVLREEGNGEDIVSRMLPMSRIVPGEVKEREKKKPAAPISTKEPCTRPECMANRNRIQEMQDANEAVREQLEEVEIGIRQMMAKLEGLEKSNRSADQQNDELEGTNNELEQQIGMLEIEAEEGNRQKRDLHKKIAQLEKEIEMFMKQTEERNKQREQALKSNQNEVNFGGKGFKTSAEPFDKLFVSSLDMWDRQWGGLAHEAAGLPVNSESAENDARQGLQDADAEVPREEHRRQRAWDRQAEIQRRHDEGEEVQGPSEAPEQRLI
eukprot:CAMPEP_0182462166 /NCGR_PEP_ID=MMETSP1319-20130603/6524_1 /TAXON_ID=172717 /ORGANISM="Bolidomonas pacifica, Strain RCC208" /LENGTH=295 /DNA_ID=CAMNT_0024661561 /DNA_START=97 /DNA_END=983 /DNA_ORIENTATION=+